MWIQVPGQRQQQPVLMTSDSTTRLRGGERIEEFIKQLERALGHFGPIKVLPVDEHRAWSSDQMREWCTEQGIQLQVSPGQAHAHLAILERRHQVTRRAVSLFLQATRPTTLHRLDPSERLLEKLRLQQEAAKATAQADGDHRLRRALLRNGTTSQTMLERACHSDHARAWHCRTQQQSLLAGIWDSSSTCCP